MVSRTFQAEHDQNAVQSAFAETVATACKAWVNTLRLFILRQLSPWTQWPPWLALLGVGCITGMALSESLFGFEIAFGNQLDAYVRYGVHFNTGLTVRQDIIFLVCVSVALFGWSWISGFVLGSLSRRVSWMTAFLFNVIALNFWPARLSITHNPHSPTPVLSLPALIFTRVFHVLPRNLEEFLVFVVPAFLGVFAGMRRNSLRPQLILRISTTMAIVTSAVTWTSRWYGIGNRAWGAPGFSWQIALLGWPLLYLITTATWSQE